MALLQTDFVREGQAKIHVEGKLTSLCSNLRVGLGFAVIDRFFCNKKGAAAWIIKGANGTNRIVGTYATPGSPYNHSAI